MPNRSQQAEREVAHSQGLAAGDTERTWGWGTPAGQLRARRRAELIISGAGLGSGVRAVEIGCGTGLFTEMFARTGVDLVAIDISGALLERAKTRDLPPDRVRFVEGPLEDVPLEGPFDAVIGSSVLHHLDLPVALSRIHSLLKPGGRLCFAEPNMLNPQVFLERKFRRWFPSVSPDETAFVRYRLHRLLSEKGFTGISIAPFDWLHPATPPLLIPLVQRVGRWFELIPGTRECRVIVHPVHSSGPAGMSSQHPGQGGAGLPAGRPAAVEAGRSRGPRERPGSFVNNHVRN